MLRQLQEFIILSLDLKISTYLIQLKILWKKYALRETLIINWKYFLDFSFELNMFTIEMSIKFLKIILELCVNATVKKSIPQSIQKILCSFHLKTFSI